MSRTRHPEKYNQKYQATNTWTLTRSQMQRKTGKTPIESNGESRAWN